MSNNKNSLKLRRFLNKHMRDEASPYEVVEDNFNKWWHLMSLS